MNKMFNTNPKQKAIIGTVSKYKQAQIKGHECPLIIDRACFMLSTNSAIGKKKTKKRGNNISTAKKMPILTQRC